MQHYVRPTIIDAYGFGAIDGHVDLTASLLGYAKLEKTLQKVYRVNNITPLQIPGVVTIGPVPELEFLLHFNTELRMEYVKTVSLAFPTYYIGWSHDYPHDHGYQKGVLESGSASPKLGGHDSFSYDLKGQIDFHLIPRLNFDITFFSKITDLFDFGLGFYADAALIIEGESWGGVGSQCMKASLSFEAGVDIEGLGQFTDVPLYQHSWLIGQVGNCQEADAQVLSPTASHACTNYEFEVEANLFLTGYHLVKVVYVNQGVEAQAKIETKKKSKSIKGIVD
eukprot:CAMPEP_0113304106 /NCGR_PEP_ID=MMETSP0010_2-20120614/4242_1 /TAXON_ID=216773 ORGANISM="Corethron hystrix, Strain 308" /NCGR_SAMPLE_ID=MMETSP0010_2 /ASSEMBLY_ACC=CAM_ASM_000155 /LENGTH=280 /DNA_ID=CAMNT_0000158211 /DNA_START=2525 /DNA_END=3368 /DNA_ORIENTATION=+ /assembly_acc=CAM_ASM_000155